MKVFTTGDVVGGRYELRRALGQGGICNVFEGMHRFTRRLVAVKCLNEEYGARSDARDRLRLEAMALGGVSHPHVVDILDAGVDEEVPFVVMELLHGRSLEALLAARERLPVADVVTLGIQLASALGAVHGSGVVHRDVKPSNVFIIAQATGQEHAKLLDFGVARYIEQPAPIERITAQNALVGTYEYMAPEQLLTQNVDTRTDLYALGMVLYECLVGDLPTRGNMREMLWQLAQRRPVRVRDRAPDVPASVAAVVDRCLAWDPNERWQDALQLIAALAQTAAGRPLQLLEPSAMAARPVVREDGEGRRITVLSTLPVSVPAAPVSDLDDPRNRREHARVPYLTPVRLTAGSLVVDGRVEDISVGGVLVIARQPLPVGATVTMRMALPTTGAVVPCSAVVRWARVRQGAGNVAALGLHFVDPSPMLLDSVRTFVAQMNSPIDARRSLA